MLAITVDPIHTAKTPKGKLTFLNFNSRHRKVFSYGVPSYTSCFLFPYLNTISCPSHSPKNGANSAFMNLPISRCTTFTLSFVSGYALISFVGSLT